METVLGVLRACSPMVASFIDEHCGIFVDGAGTAAVEVEVFNDFRRTVDQLLTDLLTEVGMGLGDVALTLHLAREQPGEAIGGSLVAHLLAVESFASFRLLSALPLPFLPSSPRHATARATNARPRHDVEPGVCAQ